MATDRLAKILVNFKSRGHQVSGDPRLDRRTYSFEVGNRPRRRRGRRIRRLGNADMTVLTIM
jgi:hypothetical protein